MGINVEKKGPVTTVIISNKATKNAIDRVTAVALAEAFREFEADAKARVAVLYGDLGTFCSGADLKAIAEGNPNRIEPAGDGPLGPTRSLLTKPVIAAVSGFAVAGGLELALWCDLRVAEEDSVFGVFCRRWGIPFMDGGTIRLPRLIGLSRALDLILTGRSVSAKEAFEMGLVNRLVPQGTVRQAAEELAMEISKFPQTCMRNDRLSAYEQFHLSLRDAFTNEYEHGLVSLKAMPTEGMNPFQNKRTNPPV